MKVKIKKLTPDAVTPSYAKPGDAGLDITASTNGTITSSEETDDLFVYLEYGTGLSIEIPEGYVGLIFPRSSISKTALMLTNSVGVIDSGYRGEIKFRFKIDATAMRYATEKRNGAGYKKGDRIGQLIIVPYPTIELEETTDLSESERGTEGFGSTGA